MRPQEPQELKPYWTALQKWMPNAVLRLTEGDFDGFVDWDGPREHVRYLVEEKRHLGHQDVRVVAEQLLGRRHDAEAVNRDAKLLLLAPFIRPQQARILERAGVEYLDLAGNAHLEAPGLYVHVEGRRPPKQPERRPVRPQRGWIKTVMAMLIRPELVAAPYRTVAEQADMALGTVAACMNDLTARGLLHDARDGRRLTDRAALVALWVQAYVETLRPKLEERLYQMRAATKHEIWERMADVLGKHEVPWALTGADAAAQTNRFFHTKETEVYAPIHALNDHGILNALVAQPAERDGNLLVAKPPGPLAIPREADDRFPLAPPLLTYAELRYRGTEQALEAAEMLLPQVLAHVAD